MWTKGPFTITGAVINVGNPTNPSGSAKAQGCQVANASGWIVEVQTANGQVFVQPFTATTVPVRVGLDVLITPITNVYNFPIALNQYVTVSFLLPGERSPQPDGPLSAAATIASATLAGPNAENYFSDSFNFTTPAPASQIVIPGSGSLQVIVFFCMATGILSGGGTLIHDMDVLDSNGNKFLETILGSIVATPAPLILPTGLRLSPVGGGVRVNVPNLQVGQTANTSVSIAYSYG